MFKANVYLDLDGVVRNLSKAIIDKLLDEFYIHFCDRFLYEDVVYNNVVTMDIFNEQDFQNYINFFINDIYYRAPAVNGAYDFINYLKICNYKVIINTSQLQIPEAVVPTIDWIYNNLPEVHDIILNRDHPKDIFESDIPSIMIDDDPTNFPDNPKLIKFFVANKGEQRIPELLSENIDNLYTVHNLNELKKGLQAINKS